MINPVWLRSFCTLVDVGHFTRTAERLFMTQSGVSQHIRKLEEHLDVPLLVRKGKQFELTDAGQRLYEESYPIIKALSDLERCVQADPPYAGEVKLMSPGSVGLRLYPKLLELQQSHPTLIIDYRFAPNSEIEKSIAESLADIGLMTQPSSIVDVQCRPVAEEALVLVTPKSVKRPNWRQLQALGFVGHPDGHHHATLLLRDNYPEFEHIELIEKKGFSNQINLILEPVAKGFGFTVLPTHAVEAFPGRESVNVHRLEKPVSETLYLATRAKVKLANRIETVIQSCLQWI